MYLLCAICLNWSYFHYYDNINLLLHSSFILSFLFHICIYMIRFFSVVLGAIASTYSSIISVAAVNENAELDLRLPGQFGVSKIGAHNFVFTQFGVANHLVLWEKEKLSVFMKIKKVNVLEKNLL